MKYNLWLDDLRPLPNDADNSWKVAKSTKEAIDIVENFGVPDFICFDHDLGALNDGSVDEAKYFARWLAENYYDEKTPEFKIHSSNSQGGKDIISIMNSWKKSKEIK